MALLDTLTIDGNETVFVKCKNARNGRTQSYTAVLYGDFGSGTVTAQVSADGGSTYVNIQESGSDVTFTANGAKEFVINSDEMNPVYLAFTMSGSSSPDLVIRVYDGR